MKLFLNKAKLLMLFMSTCMLMACGHRVIPPMTIGEQWGKVVYHGFEFDVRKDSPGIDILDYEYSTEKPTKEAYLGIGGSSIAQWNGIFGGFPVGDFIYMKWRIRSTGEVFEDRVNLRGRLPSDITDHKIYCVIDGKQLYVLLIPSSYFRNRVTTDELNKSKSEVNNPLTKVLHSYILHRVRKIYPDPITQLR